MSDLKCPVCDSIRFDKKYSLRFNIYECQQCHLQMCKDAAFDSSFISSLDEKEREQALEGLRKENFAQIISFIKKINPTVKGLEIGSSYGWFLESCKDNGITCDGIEPETRFNDQYRINGFNVRNGFYPAIINDSEKYDFISFNDVLEHIPDIDSTMKTNYTILNDKGLLIINIPIQEGLFYFFSKLAFRIGIKDLLNRMWQFNFHSPHIYYFKKDNVIALGEKHGFSLIDAFKLKTIRYSEISKRIKQDQSQSYIINMVSLIGTILLYPFTKRYPDIYCFIFRKEN